MNTLQTPGEPTSLAEAIMTRRLLVTAGSGGVGKTTTAAALALQAARRGRKVAVLTIDPARRLANALGLQTLTGELRAVDAAHLAAAGFALSGELWAMMLDTKTTGDAMVARFAPDPDTAREILENPYYRYFSTSLAGAQEYMAVEQVRTLVQEGGFDLVVLDTPPAAHALEFLDAPERLLSALRSPAMLAMRRGREAGAEGSLGARLMSAGRGLVFRSLSRLTGGTFIEDLGAFLGVFGHILGALEAASTQVQALLRADSTRFLLVTAPARANLEEAMAFRGALMERSFPFGGFICNRVHLPYPAVAEDAETQAELAAALADEGLSDVPLERRAQLVGRLVAGLSDHNRLAIRDQDALDRLASAAREPAILVPLMPRDVADLDGLDRMGRWLTGCP